MDAKVSVTQKIINFSLIKTWGGSKWDEKRSVFFLCAGNRPFYFR